MKLINPKKSAKTASHIGIVMGIIVALVAANVLFTIVTGTHFRSGENILSMKEGSKYKKEKIIANRGHIYDRSKEVIAQDIESYDLFAYIDEERVNAGDTPVYVVDYDKTSQELAKIIESDPSKVAAVAESLKNTLESAKKAGQSQTEFGNHGRNLTAEQKEKIENLGLTGLDFTKSTSRAYPVGTFASQLIGFTEYDDNRNLTGVTGLEKTFDKELSGASGEVVYQTDSSGNRLPNTQKYTKIPETGNDVYLTIDRDTQLALEKALQQTMESNNANYAWGIVMEAKTGKVLAQAGYPTYDLNTKEGIEKNEYNITSDRPFEVGSVMKAFVYAAAMNEGVYDGNAMFQSKTAYIGVNAEGNPVRIDSPEGSIGAVNDALGNDKGIITYDQGLIYSTNTAIASLLTNYLNIDKNIEYLKKFKLFESVDMYGLSDRVGVLNAIDSDPFSKMAIGFGQASTINSYQIVQAATAIFGDGTLIKPYIVDKIVDPNTGDVLYQGKTEKVGQPITAETAKKIQALMRQVVDDPGGTANHYKMSDITMMAKTGTGEIAFEGEKGYSREYFTSSILAAAPAEDPEIIVYYAFESSNIRNYSTDYFKDIVRESLSALDKYNESSQQTTSTENTTTENTNYSQYIMPSLVNHSLDYVKQKLEGFDVKTYYIGDGTNIISQFPLTGSTVLSKQNIFLLTDGTNIKVPNMSGWSRKDVSIYAKLCGLDVTYTGKGGTVRKQSLGEGTVITKDSKLEVELE
ncbi:MULTISPECIES: penicillin-binding protein [unclassified Breznakia]|uniref:penicillin-binding protein n=1 Tax=unclassified Breznakia TaxID=2623764 RepID=UPI0024059EA9|nr:MULTISPECIES: penicillin-binding protein [unclassified Breznakia]MDF9837677.1 penicillin-binding protein 2B [Breznakia sp. PFB2-8]MDF9859541.1 penicillin-binding protein 2B [Breznakia sp. PH5-24]